MRRRFTRRGWVLGRTILTTTIQAAGAPVVDSCHTETEQGHRGGGITIRLQPTSGPALVVARVDRPAPDLASLQSWFGRRLTRPRWHLA